MELSRLISAFAAAAACAACGGFAGTTAPPAASAGSPVLVALDVQRAGHEAPLAACPSAGSIAGVAALPAPKLSTVRAFLTDGLGLLDWQSAMRAAEEGQSQYVEAGAPRPVPGSGIPADAVLLPGPLVVCWYEGEATDGESGLRVQRAAVWSDLSTGTATLAQAASVDLPVLAPRPPADLAAAEKLLGERTPREDS